MNAKLPDVSVSDSALVQGALSEVGMDAIDLPITLADPIKRPQTNARVRSTVNLPLPHVKGIHMSRLYRLLMPFGDETMLTPANLCLVLQQMIASHEDCGSDSAELAIEFDVLMQKAALKTPGLFGWSAYPVTVKARLQNGQYELRLQVSVGYSSTCPCSAALARQLISERFASDFSTTDHQLDTASVVSWLEQNATLATPHSQRSRADVTVALAPTAENLGLPDLIERIEQALQTPLQTAVKRADEQAFAERNGSNLMFVEDSARRINDALSDYEEVGISVSHLESLHPHDAIAGINSERLPV